MERAVRRRVPGSKPPKNVRPVTYRVGYTWNRGGRLKELRIRNLARKFLLLWIRKTFGRVLPSTARLHHSSWLLRSCFDKWKEEWWVLRKEWRLGIRAECHHRYVLYRLCFQAWQRFVLTQRKKKQKDQVAECHAQKHVLFQALQRWIIYVRIQRTKKQMLSEALEFRGERVLRNSWKTWTFHFQQKEMAHKMETLALKHWSFSLQSRAWLQWKALYFHIQMENEREERAMMHHRRWKLQEVLRAWLLYLYNRREKKREHRLAMDLYHKHLTGIYFSSWRGALERARSVHTVEEHCETLAGRCVLRRAFNHWKHYMLICSEKYHLSEIAQAHDRRRLLRFGCHMLKVNVCQVHASQLRNQQAAQQYDVMLICRSWKIWQSRLEQKEEEQIRPLTMAAHAHYRQTLMLKSFNAWLQYKEIRQMKRVLRRAADDHFARSTLPRSFQRWREHQIIQKQNREMEEQATQFHRYSVQRWILSTWCQKLNQQRENRLSERMAILHCNWRLLEQHWIRWKDCLVSVLEEREADTLAVEHCRRARLSKALQIWKANVYELKSDFPGSVTRLAGCLSGYDQSVAVISPVALVYHQHVVYCSVVIGNLHADSHLDKGESKAAQPSPCLRLNLCHLLMSNEDTCPQQITAKPHTDFLHNAFTCFCIRRGREEDAVRHHCQCRVQKAWRCWRMFVAYRLQKRQSQLSADLYHQQRLLARTLVAWKLCCWNSRKILLQVEEKNKQHKDSLLRASLYTWRRHAVAQSVERRLEAQALHHYRTMILKQVLHAWRDTACMQAHRRAQKDETLREAVKSLQRGRLSFLFHRWMECSCTAKELRLKMEMAAEYHAKKLLMICIKNWKCYHDLCLRKTLLQRQEGWFTARRLGKFILGLWHQRLVEKQEQDKKTIQALWHWSLTLQGKVFDGWVAYVWERRRKKSRINEAVDVYRTDLLREGVSRILHYMSDMKHLRAQKTTQYQVKEVYTLNLAARHCAMVWKEKVFKKRTQVPPKKVTFDIPPFHVPRKSDVSHTVPPSALQSSSRDRELTAAQGSGEPMLRYVSTLRSDRLKPRTPEFLLHSLEKEGLLGSVLSDCTMSDHAETDSVLKTDLRPEPAKPEQGIPIVPPYPVCGVSICPAQPPAAVKTTSAEASIPTVDLSSPPAAPVSEVAPHSKPQPSAPIPALRPPSSFTPLPQNQIYLVSHRLLAIDHIHIAQEKSVNLCCVYQKQKFLKISIMITLHYCYNMLFRTTAVPRGVELPRHDYSKRLLSPSDFLHGLDTQALTCSSKVLGDPISKHAEVERKTTALEQELAHIQRAMQQYHDEKQELKSLRRHAGVLRKWLDTSDPLLNPDELLVTEEVQTELQQLDLQIEKMERRRTTAKKTIQDYIIRTQEIREALGSLQ
ncbi:protein SFI1 homolog [Spea bombifrons]|uniref:protein SFI1 homolog n=1 Tax=Spea bombifrons TaxID=233779 RepID=UPI00234A7BAC|nr:protein SFI1 homolog [Spea bombifrons]